jgi:hypothetical protein
MAAVEVEDVCGSPGNSETHDPAHVVSEQPGTVAVEQNVTSDGSEYGSISTEMQRNTVVKITRYYNASARSERVFSICSSPFQVYSSVFFQPRYPGNSSTYIT